MSANPETQAGSATAVNRDLSQALIRAGLAAADACASFDELISLVTSAQKIDDLSTRATKTF